jgi:hypothetical protein
MAQKNAEHLELPAIPELIAVAPSGMNSAACLAVTNLSLKSGPG